MLVRWYVDAFGMCHHRVALVAAKRRTEQTSCTSTTRRKYRENPWLPDMSHVYSAIWVPASRLRMLNGGDCRLASVPSSSRVQLQYSHVVVRLGCTKQSAQW